MGEDEQKQSSWWGTIPGILTGIAALVTATAGLLAAIQQFGWFEPKPSAGVAAKSVVTAGQTDNGGPGQLTAAAADKKSGDGTESVNAAVKPGLTQMILRNGDKHEVFAESFGFQSAGWDIPLRSGQTIKIELLKQIEITDTTQADSHVGVKMTTREGAVVNGTIVSGSSAYSFVGANSLGTVNIALPDLKAVVFAD